MPNHKPYSQRERDLYLRLMLAIGALVLVLIVLATTNADRIDGKPTCPAPSDQGQRVVIYAVPDGNGGLKDDVHFQPVGFGESCDLHSS